MPCRPRKPLDIALLTMAVLLASAFPALAQAGRITLPFGYYNSRRFYPFQRVELTAPIYISSILGLPIADAGAALSRRFDLGSDWGVDVRAYGVNGYGGVAGSSVALRNPALPGGLGMSGNLGAGNNNKDIAVGGQVALSRDGVGEVGTSYYRGAVRIQVFEPSPARPVLEIQAKAGEGITVTVLDHGVPVSLSIDGTKYDLTEKAPALP